MKPTAHTESGKLQSVLIKPVQHAFLDNERIDAEWEMLNYLGRPDLEKPLRNTLFLSNSSGMQAPRCMSCRPMKT